MFKRIFLALCLLVLCISVSSGGITDKLKSVIARKNVAGGTTDSTADPNCMGAWFTNGGLSANGDDEIDRSGEGETLTETGGDIPNSATVPGGYSGTSRDFEDGDTEGLVHADGGSTDISGADQALTLAAWIKYEANPDSDDAIINKYYVVGNERQYKISFRNSDSAVVGYISNDGTAFSKAIGGTDINDTNWHHVVGTWEVGGSPYTLSLTFDGVQVTDTDAIATPAAFSGVGQIGCSNGTLCFPGLIDHVKIYNYARTPAQIAWDYNRGKPIAHWKFDECKGSTILDWAPGASGNAANANPGQLYLGTGGTITATGTCASSSSSSFWGSGTSIRGSGAGSFDGTDNDDFVAVPHNSLFNLTDYFTVSAWVKLESDPGSYYNVFSKTKDVVFDANYYMQIIPGQKFIVGFGASGGWRETQSQATLALGEWHHLLGIFDNSGNKIDLYIDGKFDTTKVNTYTPNTNTGSVDIGAYQGVGGYGGEFDGLIDEVKIFNYALTEEQVRVEYAGGAVRFGN